jgi:sugar O-acyltransferase (sialic acid O-acetyltransferase NeuD family)
MPQEIVILGTNGNCIDIFETIESINAQKGWWVYECRGFLDDNESLHGQALCGVRVLGPLARAAELAGCCFVNGIGSPASYLNKAAIIASTGVAKERFITLVHPTAAVSRSAEIGRGTVIFEHVTISSNVRIGDHVIILPGAVISHDVRIGDYSCIAGGVCIAGGARIGRQCYLGMGGAIGNISIGDCSLVGMGSVVLEDVAENSVVVGNPARFLRHAR